MNAFLRRLAGLGRLSHLSDELLSKLLNDELGSMREAGARAHLAGCWQCKVRYDQLEKAAHQVVEYRRHEVQPRLPQSPKRRDSFLAQLDQMMTEATPEPWWSRALSFVRRPAGDNMTPVLASAIVIVLAAVVLVFIWQRWAQPVSAAELLTRASASDSNSRNADHAGVVYQRVRIKTARKIFERDLYRDEQGRRRPRREPLAPDVKPIEAELEVAGVIWDQPLSAETFKDWHDHQRDPNDQVKRSGNNLLTLTTSTSDGNVTSESLTVRESDFHPVQRTVELRDAGTIEIAELDYTVLAWNAVNESLFEPLSPALSAVAVPPPALLRPTLPTPTQLDDAELQARLVLNRLNADTGEQIRITQTNSHVEIKGIVETDDRKRELVAQLRSIPHVSQSILSVEELRSNPNSAPPVTSIKEYANAGQPSPLGQYMRERNRSADELSQVSQRLLDACLKVQQGAAALSGLLDRFPSTEALTPSSRSVQRELIWNYAGSINAGLDTEAATLQVLGFAPPSATGGTDNGVPIQSPEIASDADAGAALTAAVQRNQALCRELIAGGEGSPRSAAEIAADLLHSSARVRIALSQWQSQSPGH
jgi:hypothetical protein